jgi:hypothetical protein
MWRNEATKAKRSCPPLNNLMSKACYRLLEKRKTRT